MNVHKVHAECTLISATHPSTKWLLSSYKLDKLDRVSKYIHTVQVAIYTTNLNNII